MRVESEADFESQMDRAISEAIAALEMALFYRKICGFAKTYRNSSYGRQSWECAYLEVASSVVTKVIEEAVLRFSTFCAKKMGEAAVLV
jgi:propionyl-CoA carboxylase alpha chain